MSDNKKSPDNSRSKVRSDRCINPFKVVGHMGKVLRKMPKKLLENFPNLSENRICRSCLDMCSQNETSQSLDRTLLEESEDSDTSESSPNKRQFIQGRSVKGALE